MPQAESEAWPEGNDRKPSFRSVVRWQMEEVERPRVGFAELRAGRQRSCGLRATGGVRQGKGGEEVLERTHEDVGSRSTDGDLHDVGGRIGDGERQCPARQKATDASQPADSNVESALESTTYRPSQPTFQSQTERSQPTLTSRMTTAGARRAIR